MKKALVFLAMTAVITFLLPKGVMATEFTAGTHDTIYKPGSIYIFEAKVDSVSKSTQRSCPYKMRYLAFSQWKYKNRLVEVCEQIGFAKSSKGEFSVTYRYNDKLGLVAAVYDFNHEIQIRLSLIDVVKPQ